MLAVPVDVQPATVQHYLLIEANVRLNPRMATKGDRSSTVPTCECTHFQLKSMCRGALDFTEAKLRSSIAQSSSSFRKIELAKMLSDYEQERVAIGFWKGMPIAIPVSNDG